MLSITQFKKNIYPLFYLMRRTGAVFEIAYKGVVYDVHIQTTKKKPVMTRAKKSRLETSTVHRLDMTSCQSCGSVVVAGICMNGSCESNLQTPTD